MAVDRTVASRDGLLLAVHELGDRDGKPVIMAHGFSSSVQRNWIDAGWDAALTAAGLRGIAFDLRGHGESEKPETGYEVTRFLDDVTAVIDDAGVSRPGYLGYSMGSRLGWRFAAQHPGVLSALALGGLPDDDPFHGIDPDQARLAVQGLVDPVGPTEFVVKMALGLPENDASVLVALATEVSATRFTPADGAPQEPVLLMTGDRDDRAPDSESLVALVDDGRFLPIPGRNHVNAITSRHFKAEVTAFLAEHVAG